MGEYCYATKTILFKYTLNLLSFSYRLLEESRMEANYPAEEKGLSWPQVYLSNTTLIIVLLSFIIYLRHNFTD